MNTNFNGICYAPFSQGYNPSIANTTYIFLQPISPQQANYSN
ncbi:hypothetical protein [Flavobacterium hydrophilum]|nr:hypothetical protein [Flavobacterium hydrophilum]